MGVIYFFIAFISVFGFFSLVLSYRIPHDDIRRKEEKFTVNNDNYEIITLAINWWDEVLYGFDGYFRIKVYKNNKFIGHFSSMNASINFKWVIKEDGNLNRYMSEKYRI